MELPAGPIVPRFLSVFLFLSALAKPVIISLAWSLDNSARRSIVTGASCLLVILLGGVLIAASNYIRFWSIARKTERAARADGTVSEEDLAAMRIYFHQMPIWGDAWAKVSKSAWGFAFLGPLIYWVTSWGLFGFFDISFAAWLILLGGFAIAGILMNGLAMLLMSLASRRGERTLDGETPRLLRFSDTGTTCWSRVDLENGEPVWISVARSSVLVRASRLGFMGAVLFKERNVDKLAEVCADLDLDVLGYTVPENMKNPVLRLFTQVAMECESAAALSCRLNGARDGLG